MAVLHFADIHLRASTRWHWALLGMNQTNLWEVVSDVPEIAGSDTQKI